jgi:hypothetical protein
MAFHFLLFSQRLHRPFGSQVIDPKILSQILEDRNYKMVGENRPLLLPLLRISKDWFDASLETANKRRIHAERSKRRCEKEKEEMTAEASTKEVQDTEFREICARFLAQQKTCSVPKLNDKGRANKDNEKGKATERENEDEVSNYDPDDNLIKPCT